MYGLEDCKNEIIEEKSEKIKTFENIFNNIPPSNLLYIFNELLHAFSTENIYHPYLEYSPTYNFNMLSFVSNTIDDEYKEKRNKVKDFDFNISFEHYLEQYEIKFSRNRDENKEYINIVIYSSTNVLVNKHQIYNDEMKEFEIRKNYSTTGNRKAFELIIYSLDKIFIKMRNNKIIPLHLSNIYYYPNNIFKILFNIFAKYNPIYKDLLREIDNRLDFLHIDFSLINSCHTKKDILENIFKMELRKSINKYTLNEGYAICCALKLVDKKDYCKIYEHASNIKSTDKFQKIFRSTYHKSKNDIGLEFIKDYYINKNTDLSQNINWHIFYDSLNGFLLHQQKNNNFINLNISSQKKLKDYSFWHIVDTNAKKAKSFRIPKKNNFNELELPVGFERIKSKKELIELSKKTKINFFTLSNYYGKIADDSYALYVVKINNNYFMIIVKMVKINNITNGKKYKYSLVRTLAPNNDRVPFEFYEDMYDIINKYNNKFKLGGLINEL